MLSTISFIAVITNACILGFVSTQMALKGTEEEENIENRFRSYRIWIGVIGFEHAVVLLKVVVGFAMPDQPRWIDSAKDQLAHYRDNKLLTKKQQEHRATLHAEQEATKEAGLKANLFALSSNPQKNEKLDPSRQDDTPFASIVKDKLTAVFTGKKQQTDAAAPQNRFGGGRVGKVGGSTTVNPMQEMVSRARVAAPICVSVRGMARPAATAATAALTARALPLTRRWSRRVKKTMILVPKISV